MITFSPPDPICEIKKYMERNALVQRLNRLHLLQLMIILTRDVINRRNNTSSSYWSRFPQEIRDMILEAFWRRQPTGKSPSQLLHFQKFIEANIHTIMDHIRASSKRRDNCVAFSIVESKYGNFSVEGKENAC